MWAPTSAPLTTSHQLEATLDGELLMMMGGALRTAGTFSMNTASAPLASTTRSTS
jgi:hypothetical protein